MEADDRRPVIALAGNPNCGKTTIFNNLTGARQHVGNWPGVTVEKKEGTAKYDVRDFQVVDLPGTYSLTAYSLEEVIVRDYITGERPDLVVDIVDASNVERNLYLTTQLMELGVPVIIALNMVDVAEGRGIEIDQELMSELLGMPIVPTVGHRNKGTDELKKTVMDALSGKVIFRDVHVSYGKEIEEEIRKLVQALVEDPGTREDLVGQYSARWLAIKLLEEDERVREQVAASSTHGSSILDQAEASLRHLSSIFREDVETVIVDNRYGYVAGIAKETVQREKAVLVTVSDKIDRILTSKYLGYPIFALFMWLMFYLTFTLGTYPQGWIDQLISGLGNWVSGALTSPVWLQSLLVDGIIGGVGSVLVFLPQIFIIFLCISILEDTGYMARAAFIMDRIMHWLGLHGKSFIPMIMGFGCNVPAIMATRTLESRRDRMITILINPLMSCAARLPVYALFTAAFFAANQGSITFSIYILGIILAVTCAKLFRRFLFPGESEPFVMELPPYRLPTIRGTFIHMWERGSTFIKKAGTIILAGSIIIWILAYLPPGAEYGSAQSLAGKLGHFFAPIFKPLGFDWRAAVALLFGFVAKEIVVSTYGAIFGVGEERAAIVTKLRGVFTPLSGYAFMVFTLVYTPCIATVAVIKKETGSWKWTGFAIGYSLVLAWILAFLIYNVGRLVGLG